MTRSPLGPGDTSDGLAGGPVDMAEPVELAAQQHRVDSAGGQACLIGDRDWPQTLLPGQVHDLADHRLRGLVRLAVLT